MASPLPPGLAPSEIAFLCEMELITIVPRQKLERIDLLSGTTPTLRPPRRENVPLWLALLLKKQRRANILPPPWLHPDSLDHIIKYETKVDPVGWAPPPPPSARADGRGNARRTNRPGTVPLSAPFLSSCTSDAPSGAIPYHWFELAEMLLAHAADDITSSAEVRGLLRDLQEVRSAKLRAIPAQLEAGIDGVMSLRGVGAMELAESRGLIGGVIEGVRKIGASAELSRREEEEQRGDADMDNEASDDDGMGF
ncbi:DNA replication complex GINS protein PSF2 [Emericellopsis cladophorae]|uniref:DNA replication complex GINS protein PSF2 n=1 Tax=Emericellopsis cladophorae TaxID=2686198 RepID=A0A9Q0BHL8_9HYPO|nr:DNA replication complex GINS protein PSF2 [Emericellopsis cladophorae]KAI6785241.1 DNA replication complex GINS protein PSF2 [Emericellopsis cladophorae]